MKKLILFYFLTIGYFNQTNAQILGKSIVGGSLSYTSTTDESIYYNKETYSKITISPTVGTMINEKTAIGLTIGYSSLTNKSDGNTVDESETLIINPFIRIHQDITDNLKYFIEPNAGKTFALSDESDNKLDIYNVGVNIGLLYFVSQKLSLELNIISANYISISDKDIDLKTKTFSLDYNLTTPNIGLKYYF